MRELIYTPLELSKESKKTCDFCSNLHIHGEDNKPVKQIVTQVKSTSRWISDDVVCEDCQEKFLNNKIPKCERCGRLQTKGYKDFFSANIPAIGCFNEDLEEKKLPLLPGEEISQAAFYEWQINGLKEELATTEEALEIEREKVAKFQEKSEEWSKRQKQELLDKIKSLEEKNKQLEEENKLLKGQQNGLIAQIEVKENKR